jgi:hypothetical protein
MRFLNTLFALFAGSAFVSMATQVPVSPVLIPAFLLLALFIDLVRSQKNETP